MKNKPQQVDWTRRESELDFELHLRQYKKYLLNEGYRESTIQGYSNFLKLYLKYAKTNNPTIQDAGRFREYLIETNKKRSTINNYSFAIRLYHRMVGEKIKFPVLKRNNQIPYFFTEDEILKIFSVCNNIKHYAMLKTLFYGCLRVSELCALCDEDLSLNSLTMRIGNGKNGRGSIVPISVDCAETLKEYLRIRPKHQIQGKNPLFYTYKGNFWDRRDVYRMFIDYKAKAGLKDKPGGLHVFARHSAASILIKNGYDIMTIKELLRHNDIATTARYLHLSDQTRRQKYEEYLVL
jgi:integrase/recombinase XerD